MRYVCNKMPGNNHCGKTYVLTASTDECVRGMVKVALDSPEFVKTIRSKDQGGGDEAVHQQLTADQHKLEELAGDYATDDITRKEWLRMRELLEDRLEAARKRLSATSPSAAIEGLLGDSVVFGEVWEGLSLPRRRAAISCFLIGSSCIQECRDIISSIRSG
jgi:hypothetical protein